MRILITNDDGIYAEGLWLLVEAVQRVAEPVIVAPDREQTGVGTAVSLLRPLRSTRILPMVQETEAYLVEGTPADCVILGLDKLAGQVGAVFSGINQGANLGNDIIISGTVGGALQGYFHGLPSLAISVASITDVQYAPAARLATLLAQLAVEGALPNDVLLNVNVPSLPLEQIAGVELTRLGRRVYHDIIDESEDRRGKKHYWISRGRPEWKMDAGDDVSAIIRGRVSITPLKTDWTAAETETLTALVASLGKRLGLASGG